MAALGLAGDDRAFAVAAPHGDTLGSPPVAIWPAGGRGLSTTTRRACGAALAYYTLFSIAPLLLIVDLDLPASRSAPTRRAARSSPSCATSIGDDGAAAAQSLLQSVNKPAQGDARN